MKGLTAFLFLGVLLASVFIQAQQTFVPYPIVDTGVEDFYSNTAKISAPKENAPFYGQDAHYQFNAPSYVDHSDGTVTDRVTGLMWQKDMGEKKTWREALENAEAFMLGGYDDWRMPNAKELQSIVDYTRSPQTTQSAAIAPVFSTTEIEDPEANAGQYPFFWTSTTHLDGVNPYSTAVYIAFGEAQGKMRRRLMDVHGAGAQRSDPKTGVAENYPAYFGPQGDVRYVFNYVRCVRTVK